MSKYVFILCPPFSGSTVLSQLLQTSPQVSALPGEGQYLGPVKHLMLPGKWNTDRKFQWAEIKEEWSKFWDFGKPLLLVKSPPNFLRAKDIEQAFSPAYFIVMMRDPYALCEGLVRRRNRRGTSFRAFGYTPAPASNPREHAMEFAAGLWAQFAGRQITNVRTLQRVIYFTYEELTENTPAVLAKIMSFLPELGELNAGRRFRVHSVTGAGYRGLTNMNDTKWKCLRRYEVLAINRILEGHQDCLDFFGYRIREPDRLQDLRSAAMRLQTMLLRLTNEGREAVVDPLLGVRAAAKGAKRWRLLLRWVRSLHGSQPG